VGFLTTPETHKTKTKVEQDENGREKIVTERKDNPQHHGLYLPETSKVKSKEVVEPDGSRVVTTKEGTEHMGLATHPETHKTIAKVEQQPDGTQIIDKKSRFNEEQMGLHKPVMDQVRTKEVVDPYGQTTVLETKGEQLHGGTHSNKTKDSTLDQNDDQYYEKEGKHHHKGVGHHHDRNDIGVEQQRGGVTQHHHDRNDIGVEQERGVTHDNLKYQDPPLTQHNSNFDDRNNQGLGCNGTGTGLGNRDPLDRNNQGLGYNDTGVGNRDPLDRNNRGLGYNDTGLGNRDPLDRNNQGLGYNDTGVGNRNLHDRNNIGQGYNDTGVGFHDPSQGQQSYSNTGAVESGFGQRGAGFGNDTGVAQQNVGADYHNANQQPFTVKTTKIEKTKFQEGNLTGETPKAFPA